MRSHFSTRCFALALGLAAPASAFVVQAGPGLSLPIPDDTYNGTLASMACNSLEVVYPGTIFEVRVGLGMGHSWIGDLVYKLQVPGGTTITMMSRPGLVETVDDGSNGPGDSSNMSPLFPIQFDMDASLVSEVMGSTIDTTGVVCADDLTCTFATDPGASISVNLNALIGDEHQGTWTLCVGDAGSGDVGSIDQWWLDIDSSTLFIDTFESGDPCNWTSHASGPGCA